MIAQEGPISLELYMKLALTHPVHGYYRRNMPIGAKGDFITAPEVHQMFGELIGLWAAEVWSLMGKPGKLSLIELGPGRGTLMADALRAARIVPAFFKALDVHLVEVSETFMQSQRLALAQCGLPVTWHADWEEVPDATMIVIANEFFDALPVRHYVFDGRGWCERQVGLTPAGQLTFGLAAEAELNLKTQAEPGAILELGFAAQDIMAKIAARLAKRRGALLAIDYGASGPVLGETLQAVRHHQFTDPLDDPGEADLTAHVDFSELVHAARRAGAMTHGPIPQGVFLSRLGIFERAAALAKKADADQQLAIETALDRLARPGAAMGPHASMAELFKVLAVTSPDLSRPPGFEAEAA